MNNYRKDVIDRLIPYTEKDSRIHLLVADMGFGAIDKFKEKFPSRIVNMGIAEQGMVGIAAGMAMTGLIPVVYCISNFLVFRALEQIRNDVVLQGLNVKFIGTGAYDYFKFLGRSHTCGTADNQIFKQIGLSVFDPSFFNLETNYDVLYDNWITSKESGYIRV